MQSDQRNFILAIVLSGLILFGWSALASNWFPTANPPATKVEAGKTTVLPAPGTPRAPVARAERQSREAAIEGSPRVAIRTPKLSGSLNLRGARIDDLTLSTYRETLAKNSPNVRLLSPQGTAQAYFASFDWMGTGIVVPGADSLWRADSSELAPGRPVTLRWDNGGGQIFIQKVAVDDQYMFTVEQRIANTGAAPVVARPYALVNRAEKPADPDNWVAHIGPLWSVGGAMNYDIDYTYLTATEVGFWDRIFGTRAKPGVNSASTTGGWLGFGDKYWLTALAPKGAARIDATFRAGEGSYQGDMLRAPVIVAPGRAASVTSYFFAGAKQVNALDGYEDALGLPLFGKAIDWGWFEIVEKPMFDYLHWLFTASGNFGVAIMVLTLTVRLLIFPIAQKQFASMAQMRIVQPKMKAIQERHKDDKARQQQEIMALYKTEKINPLAGCLPIFIQIPIFFALYKVLMLTIEMRHQPFVAWLQDLSAPDPLTPLNLFGLLPFTPPAIIAIGVLPIILGVTMYIQFKLNPPPPDPVQAQIFAIMPWVLMFVMAPFAAGLQLYWATSNVLTILQQKWLYSKYPELKNSPAAPTVA